MVCLQLIKRQFGMVGQVSQAAGGASAQSTGTVCLDLARCIRDKLPIEKRDDYVELEDWLTDHDDETLAANRAQLRDYIGRGTFGNSEKEFVHCALLRLFTKKFANTCLSWAGVRANKEFTLKTSKVWELLYDVINAKCPNFQKNMAMHFNNFHKDVGKEARVGGHRVRFGDDGQRGGQEQEPAVQADAEVASASLGEVLAGNSEQVDE